MTYKRKLIEVALPLEAINRASRAEKDRKVGKPQQIHHWWARRPIVACRAMLFAQLVDDPSSRPDLYPTAAEQAVRRKELFYLIERLVEWDSLTNKQLLKKAHEEISDSCDGRLPLILDPFAGGGAIPLEAQRLGLRVRASDLNPVAVLINKALVEIAPIWAGQPPVFPYVAKSRLGGWSGATGLAEDVRKYGAWIRDEAARRIGGVYPKTALSDGTEAVAIAWVWARTVTCPNPACGIAMPLVQSWWMSKKKGKEAYVVPLVVGRSVEFSISRDIAHSPPRRNDGTVSRAGATCVGCGNAVPLAYIRSEGRSGRIGIQLMAVVAKGKQGRHYLRPNEEHIDAARIARPDNVPSSEFPERALGFRVQAYGMTHHADMFTNRQLLALTTFSDLVCAARERVLNEAMAAGLPEGERLEAGGSGAIAYADSVTTYLALAVSRLVDWCNSLCGWESTGQVSQHLFGSNKISMVWDFSEANTLASSSGSFEACVDVVARSVSQSGHHRTEARVTQADARVAVQVGAVLATDPPYYDNVPYADLSDVFYIWLRRMLGGCIYPALFSTLTTPKQAELVADPERCGGKEAAARFFEDGFVSVFATAREGHDARFPATVVYAFKQTESDTAGRASTGWQTLLEGMIRAGWEVVATWPIRSEMPSRLRGQEANALASSIVLACRPRPALAATIDRRRLIAALRQELPNALRELQQGNIAPVDLAQSAIGPGMAVFSRYSKVVEADGSTMTVRTALGLINQVLDETLSEQESDFDGATRWALAWFEDSGMSAGPYGKAETLSKAKNTSINGLVQAGFLESRGGKVRLFERSELGENRDPASDARPTVWEVTQHLIRALDTGGEGKASELLRRVGGVGESARELAYRLYVICERKKWASEALAYNSLVVAWPEIARLAAGTPTAIETRLF